MNATADADVAAELKTLDDTKIEDAFYRDLAFGTGGLRGVIGAGTNRMNVYTVAKAYIVRLGYYLLTAVIATLITNLVIGLIPGEGWVGFIVKAAVCVLISNAVIVLMLFKIPEFSDAVSLIARMFHIEKLVQRIQQK